MTQNTEKQNKQPTWMLSLIILIGAVYLAAVIFGLTKGRFGPTEVVLFLALLFSVFGILNRLTSLSISISKGKIIWNFTDIKSQQEKQQEQINALVFLVDTLLSKYELRHLKELEKGGTNKPDIIITKHFNAELRTLFFKELIVRQPEKMIDKMTSEDRYIDFVDLSKKGKQYLELRRKLGID
jgi:hypothetical protein